MDKKDWDHIVEEPMSESLKARTMARARRELDELKQTHGVLNWKWLIPLVPALGALALFLRQEKEDVPEVAEMEFMDELMELSEEELAGLDEQMLDDLELLEDLDVLEEWDGRTES